MKKLPIGIQSFEKLRTEGFYYVDKTHFVKKLVDEGDYYFLSRPRRFGKSLFLDTLKQAFLGKKELFTGLYLENNWDWGKSYPVVHLDFAGISVKNVEELNQWIRNKLESYCDEYGLKIKKSDLNFIFFQKLIEELAEKYNQKVVVLIDNYEEPVKENLENPEKAKKLLETLIGFYSVLKPLGKYLKFLLLTGEYKFTLSSIFSGLNHLNDITLSKRFSPICGFTEEEIKRVFGELLSKKELEDLKHWYNGYSWGGEQVFNPFDVLLYFQEREFRPYWFEVTSPAFVIKLLVEKNFFIPKLEDLVVSPLSLGSIDLESLNPITLLFQSGYLTIKETEESLAGIVYHLSYPNKEVKTFLNRKILSYLTALDEEILF